MFRDVCTTLIHSPTVDTQVASNFTLPWIVLQSAVWIRKCIWDLYLRVELLCFKVNLYLTKCARLLSRVAAIALSPHTLANTWHYPVSWIFYQSILAAVISVSAGIMFCHCYPWPCLSRFPSALIFTHLLFPSNHKHFLSAMLVCLFF